MKTASIIVPLYNSSPMLPILIKRLQKTYQKTSYKVQIVLVDDHSTDDTAHIASLIAKKHKNITLLLLAKNVGQHNAVLTGIRYAKTSDFIICMDDDLQTPPEESIKLLHTLEKSGADVVYARYDNTIEPWHRRLGTYGNNMMASILLGKPKHITITSFFAVKRFVSDQMIHYTGPTVYLPGLIFAITDHITSVSVRHDRRTFNTSGYSLVKLIALWMTGFTSFSTVPLRISAAIGLASFVIGCILTVILIVAKLQNPLVPLGWTSNMIALLLLSGLTLSFLGLIGEYVGRIFLSLNQKPQAVIKKII